ncbi:MAG TPA: energy transducer TonB [Pyrinomonadaceae bacterium]|nr:energy transducer TonB [Pyrinomonadaceae bacterium]
MKTARRKMFRFRFSLPGAALVLGTFFAAAAHGQRIAVITPQPDAVSLTFSEDFAAGLDGGFKILDRSMTETAYESSKPATPFNMTAAEAKSAALVIGCDAFILLRVETIRRSSFDRPEYYESVAAIYGVSGRTGELLFWDLASFEAADQSAAESLRLASAKALGHSTGERIKTARPIEVRPSLEETPGMGAGETKPPVPYRRIKPEYTRTAYLYGVRATVDIEADIDESGKITRTAIVRWAGYGLDESVAAAVKSMNWRPAMRGAKPLPMRVLLRYNFTKVEKE